MTPERLAEIRAMSSGIAYSENEWKLKRHWAVTEALPELLDEVERLNNDNAALRKSLNRCGATDYMRDVRMIVSAALGEEG